MKIIFEKKKKGLWANIQAKRKRGETPAKPGEQGYPEKEQWDNLTKEELQEIIAEELTEQLNSLEEKNNHDFKQVNIKEELHKNLLESSKFSKTLNDLVSRDQQLRNEFAKMMEQEGGWSQELLNKFIKLHKTSPDDVFNSKGVEDDFLKIEANLDFTNFAHSDWQNYWLLSQHMDNHPEFQKKSLEILKKYKGKDSKEYKFLLFRLGTNKGTIKTDLGVPTNLDKIDDMGIDWENISNQLEEIQQVLAEEIEKVFEAQQLDLPIDQADKKKEQADQIKNAQNVVNAATKEKQARSSLKSASAPEMQKAADYEFRAKVETEKLAKKNLDLAKQSALELSEQTLEEMEPFQKEMQRKGKRWKISLLTKGKQSTGSAYPNKAPMERAKSAPPGAGGV